MTRSDEPSPRGSGVDVDVLIVGAGPTGLALAAQLQSFGTRFRIIDRSLGRVHESRALAVQARTLELFGTMDLAESLVATSSTRSHGSRRDSATS